MTVIAIQQRPDLFRVLALPPKKNHRLDPFNVASLARNGDVIFHLPLVLVEEKVVWTHVQWDNHAQWNVGVKNIYHIRYEEGVNPYPNLTFDSLEKVQLWMDAWNLALEKPEVPPFVWEALGMEFVGLLLVPSSESPVYAGTSYRVESFFGNKGEGSVKVDKYLFDEMRMKKVRKIFS